MILQRLEKMLRELFGPTTAIEEKLYYQSKKNQVTSLSLLVEGKPQRIIVKYFVWGNAEKEEKILRECGSHGILVPTVIWRRGQVLFLEHLDGETIDPSRLGEPALLESLALWTAHYHEAMKKKQGTLLKRDMRPQNFISHQGKLWGIDFEEASYGQREWDVADLLSTVIEGATPGEHQETLRRIGYFLSTYERILPLCRRTLNTCLAETLRIRIIYRKNSRAMLEQWIRKLEETSEFL